jgi:NAD(P)-dependent dehydrogenase (short-subunit alcohol dehydrogenase family)
MNPSPSPRTVLITGANSGIGKAAAVRFASGGDHVVMTARDPSRGEAALHDVRAASGGSAELMELDVADLASIRRFAATFLDRHSRLDALIHNAGYFDHGITEYQFSADGLERTFATNVFGPLALTELLLDALSASPDPRILTAGSTAIKTFYDPGRAIEFDNLRGEHARDRPYSVYRMYGDSKMGLLLLTRRMAVEYADRGIRVNCVMIPTVRVEKRVLQKFSGRFRVIGPLVQYWNPFARPPAQLAECYYRICTEAGFREVTGSLLDHHGRVLTPVGADERLSPLRIAREVLFSPTRVPAYASAPENVERMWVIAREAVAPAIG